jgi:cytosine/adenosine deaminase-related metal-dependent hydrolase
MEEKLSGKATLISGANILSMSPKTGNIGSGDILVVDGKISKVGASIDIDPSLSVERFDAAGCIAMPGFVDTHRHVWQTQLRGVATDWSLFDYAANMRWRYGGCYEPEDAYLGNYAGALEALNAGITTMVDHSHITISPEHSEQALKALKDSGVRADWCFGAFRNPDYDAHDDPRDALIEGFQPVPEAVLENARHMSSTGFSGEDDLVRFGWAANEFEFYEMDAIRAELEFARDLGASTISMHAGQGAFMSHVRLIPAMYEAGLLSDDMLFVHGGNFSTQELDMLARTGVAVSSTPETEMQMGMGFPVAPQVAASGGKPSLGIDIVSNYAGDMFAQMRLMLQAERRERAWPLERQGRVPGRIDYTANEVLSYATAGGARALGLENRVGRIEEGLDADIILVRTDGINMAPVNDEVGAIVLYANIHDVDTVMVRGRLVKRHGRLVGINWDELRGRLSESRDRILRRASRIPVGPPEEFLSQYWYFSDEMRQPGS